MSSPIIQRALTSIDYTKYFSNLTPTHQLPVNSLQAQIDKYKKDRFRIEPTPNEQPPGWNQLVKQEEKKQKQAEFDSYLSSRPDFPSALDIQKITNIVDVNKLETSSSNALIPVPPIQPHKKMKLPSELTDQQNIDYISEELDLIDIVSRRIRNVLTDLHSDIADNLVPFEEQKDNNLTVMMEDLELLFLAQNNIYVRLKNITESQYIRIIQTLHYCPNDDRTTLLNFEKKSKEAVKNYQEIKRLYGEHFA